MAFPNPAIPTDQQWLCDSDEATAEIVPTLCKVGVQPQHSAGLSGACSSFQHHGVSSPLSPRLQRDSEPECETAIASSYLPVV